MKIIHQVHGTLHILVGGRAYAQGPYALGGIFTEVSMVDTIRGKESDIILIEGELSSIRQGFSDVVQALYDLEKTEIDRFAERCTKHLQCTNCKKWYDPLELHTCPLPTNRRINR